MKRVKDRLDNTAHTGRVGEFFAMYVLERHGVECCHVDRSGVDLWGQSYYEDMFTLQIKAANLATLKRKRSKDQYKYCFNIRKGRIADFHMFIALDIQRVMVKRTKDLKAACSLQLSADAFTEVVEEEGLNLLRNFRREGRPLGL